jgi:hypothetical protein
VPKAIIDHAQAIARAPTRGSQRGTSTERAIVSTQVKSRKKAGQNRTSGETGYKYRTIGEKRFWFRKKVSFVHVTPSSGDKFDLHASFFPFYTIASDDTMWRSS